MKRLLSAPQMPVAQTPTEAERKRKAALVLQHLRRSYARDGHLILQWRWSSDGAFAFCQDGQSQFLTWRDLDATYRELVAEGKM